MNKVLFQDFQKEYELHSEEYLEAFSRVMRSGWYILGPEVVAFEEEFSHFTGARYSIGVANGLEAIQIALLALNIGPGDEVITTPLSAVATTLAIEAVGATPIYVDVDAHGQLDVSLVEAAITPQTKALLPVHLYGNVFNMKRILEICDQHNLLLIEDAAQAHGAKYEGKMVGTFGKFGCWSFYPTKNLGAIGDAGALITNDPALAEKARMIRDYGQQSKYEHVIKGLNSRLDELQAALLRVKLARLPADIQKRNEIAMTYESLTEIPGLQTLELEKNTDSARHLFLIKSARRNDLQKYLLAKGVTTLIHYPKLIPDQPMYGTKYQGVQLSQARLFISEILSLPIHPHMSIEDAEYVVSCIKDFYSAL